VNQQEMTMTIHSEITMIEKRGRGGRKASEMTNEQLEAARERAAKAREKKKQLALDRDSVSITQMIRAYEAKIDSLEHQAVQYRTVIDYLESKIDSMREAK
jgi:outer membrane murein-binding lipoprotein Lpp